MRLQVGNTYTNGDGDSVKIVDFDEDDSYLPFKDSQHNWYSADGVYDGDNCQPHLNLKALTNTFTVRLPDTRAANIAVINLLMAQGYEWGYSNATPKYVADNAGMLLVRNGKIIDWFCGFHEAYVIGNVLNACEAPVNTNITFADGCTVELSLESFNKIRNA